MATFRRAERESHDSGFSHSLPKALPLRRRRQKQTEDGGRGPGRELQAVGGRGVEGAGRARGRGGRGREDAPQASAEGAADEAPVPGGLTLRGRAWPAGLLRRGAPHPSWGQKRNGKVLTIPWGTNKWTDE